jgi:hypothetical protein
LSLEPGNRPDASDFLGAKLEPIAGLNFVKWKTVQHVKVDGSAAILQLDANFSVGSIDLGNKACEKLIGER